MNLVASVAPWRCHSQLLRAVACQEQSGSGKDWDQFKTNAELFGYVSTFKAMIFNAFEGP